MLEGGSPTHVGTVSKADAEQAGMSLTERQESIAELRDAVALGSQMHESASSGPGQSTPVEDTVQHTSVEGTHGLRGSAATGLTRVQNGHGPGHHQQHVNPLYQQQASHQQQQQQQQQRNADQQLGPAQQQSTADASMRSSQHSHENGVGQAHLQPGMQGLGPEQPLRSSNAGSAGLQRGSSRASQLAAAAEATSGPGSSGEQFSRIVSLSEGS